MKLAFVYDRISKIGGAEKILQELHLIWPEAPFFTAVYNPKTAPWSQGWRIKPSFLQHFPLAKNHHELYPWLTPLAFETFNLDQFDVVISITSAEAKAVITKPDSLHICYCLTPTRYLWSHLDWYQSHPGLGGWSDFAKLGLSILKNNLRKMDLIAANRPDQYLAISRTVQKRIKKYYHRRSQIIFPPVEVTKFSKKIITGSHLPFADYFLVVSRLISYKKIDLAVKACNQLKQNLLVVGVGRELSNLKKIAGPTIHFANLVSDQQLIAYYQNCQALIMPQEEDFGITAVEAMAAGKPVISYAKGGAKETVVAGETGLFFYKQTVDSLKAVMKQFMSYSWNIKVIKAQAKKFDQLIFRKNIKLFVEEQWQKQKNFQ